MQIDNHAKFGYFLSDQVTISYDRAVVDFVGPVDFNDVEEPFPGPTNFSNALYDLRWHRFVEDERQMVRLSWKSTSTLTSGLSLLDRFNKLDSSYGPLATIFSWLASNLGAGAPEKSIGVVLRRIPSLEYRYRYLLASELELEAYWRYRLAGNKTPGRVPLDLCALYPLNGSEIQDLEMSNPKQVEEHSQSSEAGDENSGFIQALKPIISFASSAEAEFYLKGSVLYHEHLKSEQRKKCLDGY
jgi:hypothetical protein